MINNKERNGALGKIRTPDPLVRSQILYPTELPARGLCLTSRIGCSEVVHFPYFRDQVKLIIAYILLSLVFIVTPNLSIADSAFIKIGVLNNQAKSKSEVIRHWEPTADYLAMKLPGYDFEIVPLGFYEIEQAVGKGKVDFILTNPGIFVNLAARNWVTPLTTINNVIGDESYSVFGGVIFTLSKNDNINSLADLKGKRVMAVNETSLGGYLMATRELRKHGINPKVDFFQLTFTDSHEQVVESVIQGNADIGMVRTDTLERLYHSNVITPSMVKIINPIKSANFPLEHSTRLYPEWPFSRVQHTSKELAEKVTLTLLRMPSDFPSRFAGGYARWTLPRDYTQVHELFKELQLPPYAFANEFTLSDALKRYWYWPLIGILTLLLLVAAISAVIRRNKRLEQAKQKIEHQYELIVNSVTDGIYGIDTKGRCTFVNLAMETMTGWKAKDLLNKHLHPLLHHTRKDGSQATVEECPMYQSFIDDKPYFVSDDIFWNKDGSSLVVEYSSTPIRDQENKIMGGVVVFRDISERKEAKDKLQQHELQLSHVARLSMLGEMASGIAHEINQPLTAIATNSKACIRMLESNTPNIDNCADVMEKIAGQAERAGEVIRHIRHFVHKDTPKMQAVRIQAMLDTVLDLLQNELQRHDVKLTLNIADPNSQVLAQEIQIEQVILNLIRNGIEALESTAVHKREIILSTALTNTLLNTSSTIPSTAPLNQGVANNMLEIRVTDSGTGLSEKVQEQVFDPFVTTKQDGMGLGLSISQGIIEAHGDRIRVDSTDQGASFYFALPLVQDRT